MVPILTAKVSICFKLLFIFQFYICFLKFIIRYMVVGGWTQYRTVICVLPRQLHCRSISLINITIIYVFLTSCTYTNFVSDPTTRSKSAIKVDRDGKWVPTPTTTQLFYLIETGGIYIYICFIYFILMHAIGVNTTRDNRLLFNSHNRHYCIFIVILFTTQNCF